MIQFLIILNLLILPLLFWRFFAFGFAFIGLLLWKLRWILGAVFLAIAIPTWISVHQDNQQAEQRVRDYEMTHPQLPVQAPAASKIPQEWLTAGPVQNIKLDPPDIPVTGLPSAR